MLRSAAITLSILLGAACASSPAPRAPAPAAAPAAADDDAAAPAPRAPRAVIIRFGPMTDVMDSPAGQLAKTRDEIKDSAFARELASLGVEITYMGEPDRGDTVVVTNGDGVQIGSVDRHAFQAKGGTDDLMTAVRQHFGLTNDNTNN